MIQKKIGILGGGQLGKMLCLAAANWDTPVSVLEKDASFPAVPYATSFTKGDFKNYQDVLEFGRTVDILTIEIEHVNIEALETLEKEGVEIHPTPASLKIIQDKGLQKAFYNQQQLPTTPYECYTNKAAVLAAIDTGNLKYPFVQKSRKDGYDGNGVVVINSTKDADKIFDVPSIVEPKVTILKEISVIAARNSDGQIKCFEVVDMDFHPTANLVEFVACPSEMSAEIQHKALDIATKTIEALNICGLLAVELFVDEKHQIFINEVAPRPHNSGHHTLDLCPTSQFEQHLRGILNLPLGETKRHSQGVMINLLGADGHNGPTAYEGLQDCLAQGGVHLHLYGKTTTRPFRKMGHANISAATKEEAKKIARFVQNTLKIVSHEA